MQKRASYCKCDTKSNNKPWTASQQFSLCSAKSQQNYLNALNIVRSRPYTITEESSTNLHWASTHNSGEEKIPFNEKNFQQYLKYLFC